VCLQEHLVIISTTSGLSFSLKRTGPLSAIIITVFYLLALYLPTISNTYANISKQYNGTTRTSPQRFWLLSRPIDQSDGPKLLSDANGHLLPEHVSIPVKGFF
jgi:hypothetical protein